MINKKRIGIFVGVILLMFLFITFAGGTPQNQAIATRNVTFLDGYDNNEVSTQQVIVGEDAIVPSDPSHSRMVFVGWYLNEDRDTRITDFTNITEDLTVIALYAGDRNGNGIRDEEDNTYTVRFVDSINGRVISTQEVLEGMDASAPRIPTHANYTFTGWSRGYTNVRSNITVNTVYQGTNVVNADTNTPGETPITRYNVSFLDGLTNEVIAIYSVEEGLTAGTPAPRIHDGYVFVRWEGTLDNVNSDRTIRSIYAVDSNNNGIADDEEVRYTVNYFANTTGVRGSAPKYDNTFLMGQTYTVLANTFEVDNAVFIGWTTNRDAALNIVTSRDEERALNLVQPNTTLTVRGNVNYYAVFAANKNAGTGDTTPDYEETNYDLTYVTESSRITSKHVKGENVTLENTDSIDGYEFIGWSMTTGEVKTLTKKDKDIELNLITSVTFDEEDITVYAVYAKRNETTGNFEYEDDQYSVTYIDAINNKENTDTEMYVEGEEYTVKNNTFTYKSHAFVGWTTDKATGEYVLTVNDTKPTNLVQPGTATMGNANVTYYAVWADDKNNNGVPDYETTETKYTLTYKIDEIATHDIYETHVENENVLLPTTTSKETDKIKLYGWSKDSGSVKTLTKNDRINDFTTIKSVTVDADTTIYAIYAKFNENTGNFEFEDDLYTVTYDKSIDSVTGNTQDTSEYVAGEEYIVKENAFTFDDKHVFVGWTTDKSQGEKILTIKDSEPTNLIKENSKEIMGKKDVTYYAVWADDKNGNGVPDYEKTEAKVTLTYKLDDTATHDIYETHVLGEIVELRKGTNPSDSTIKFYGWSKDSGSVKTLTKYDRDFKTIDKVVLSENTTVYAIYAKVNADGKFECDETLYTVTYKNLIDNQEKIDDEQYIEDETYSIKDNEFTYENHVFVGWTLDEDTATKVLTITDSEPSNLVKSNTAKMSNQNVTYYAVWADDSDSNGIPDYKEDDKKVTLTYVTHEGARSETHLLGEIIYLANASDIDSSNKFYRWSIDAGRSITLTKENRDFAFTAISNVTLDANTTVYAIYAKYRDGLDIPEYLEELYEVTYDSGTSLKVDVNKYLEGEKYSLLENVFTTPADRVFLGWSLQKQDLVKSKEEVPNALLKPGHEFTMSIGGVKYYAVWAIDKDNDGTPDFLEKYRVEVDVLGGTTVDTNKVKEDIEYLSTVEFDTIPNEGHTDKYASASCTNGQKAIYQNNKLRVENITDNTVCTITYLEDNSGTGIPDAYRADVEVSISKEGTSEEVKSTYHVDTKETTTLVVNPSEIITVDDNVYKYANFEADNVEYKDSLYVISNLVAGTQNVNIVLNRTKVTVSYETNGHDELLKNSSSVQIPMGTSLNELPKIIEDNTDNIAFEKWVIVENGLEIEKTEEELLAMTINADTTIKAIFSLDSDNNGTADENELITVNYEVDDMVHASIDKTTERLMPNTKVSFPTITLDNGYQYAWYEGDKKVTSATVKAGEKTRTFTAKITQIDYTVKFDYNNKTDKDVIKKDYHYGDTITIPADPKDYKENGYFYKFIGWFVGDTKMTEADKIVTKSVTFTAKYEKVTLPLITATASTLNWTNDDVTITLSEKNNREVTYEYSYDGEYWEEVGSNEYISEESETVMFRATDKYGLVSNIETVEVKIDKALPKINGTSTNDKNVTFNANGQPRARVTFNVDGTISNVPKISYIDHQSKDKFSTAEDYKKYINQNDNSGSVRTINPSQIDENGNITFNIGVEGIYTIYVEDEAGNASVQTFEVKNIKEEGITSDRAGSTLISGSTGIDAIRVTYTETERRFLWTLLPTRKVTITPNEGTTITKIKWVRGNETEDYFTSGLNAVNTFEDGQNSMDLNKSILSGVYTFFVEYADKDNKPGYAIFHIYAHTVFNDSNK